MSNGFISAVVSCRIEGNKNSNLPKLMESLRDTCRSHANFEVLVKFDDDDIPAKETAQWMTNYYPFPVKFCFGPKLRGYTDIHHGYNQAWEMHDERTTVVGALADDFVAILPGWDHQILELSKQIPDNIFFLHGRHHPPIHRANFQAQPFCMDWKFEEMGDLYIIDEAPFWGRRLVEECGGFGPVSFTDAWTLALQHFLWHKHKIRRTLFNNGLIFHRVLCPEIDQIESERWHTDRKWNFEFISSDEFKNEIEREADILAGIIKGS